MAEKNDPLDVSQLAKRDLSETAFPGGASRTFASSSIARSTSGSPHMPPRSSPWKSAACWSATGIATPTDRSSWSTSRSAATRPSAMPAT